MMRWSHTLIAGSAIILLTNAVALGGAGYNRSGESESQLQLTQRELQHSSWREGKDSSGITLTLNWRIEQAALNDSNFAMYLNRWGVPGWLDRSKMAELGFDVERLSGTAADYVKRHKELQAREALLVLELNGQTYQNHMQRSRDYVEQTRKLLQASPASEDLKRKTKNAEENFLYEQSQGSRLFVIDAGLDVQKLRAAYPDRTRYAIVHGLIRPATMQIKNESRIGGYITDVHANSINVPFAYRQVFNNAEPYEVTVAFGKRLEPWLVSASKVPAAN